MSKHYLFHLLLFFVLSSAINAQNTPPEITINSVIPDTVAQTITIDFNLFDAENDPLEVSAFLSADSGTTHIVSGISISGDVGFPITPGNNKSMVISYNRSDLAAAANQSSPWSTVKITATDRQNIDINQMLAAVDSASMYHEMQYLSVPRHHVSASAGLDLVKDSMETIFLQNGFQTSRIPFSVGNISGENIRGRKPGIVDEEKVIIIDGHFDAVANTPGADDNASAVAAVLAAARIFSGYQFKKSINFIGFDKEELGLLGAVHYVANSIESYEDIEAVINGEMIGYYDASINSQQVPMGFDMLFPAVIDSLNAEDRRGVFLFVVGNTQNSSHLSDFFDSVARVYVPDVRSLVLNAPGTGALTQDLRRSDHAVFWDAGIPALMITDGADTRNPHYHLPSDQLSTINFPFLVRNTRAILATVAALAEPISADAVLSQPFQLAQGLDLAVNVNHPLSKFEVFPNPSSGAVYLRFPEAIQQEVEITVKGIGGRRILQKKIQVRANENVPLEMNTQTSGMYFIDVKAEQIQFSKKLIIHEGHKH